MRLFLSLLFTSLSFWGAFAQIEGRVLDEKSEPLPTAAVSLKQKDQLITGLSTELDGRFSIKAPPGKYQLEISFVSYRTLGREVEILGSETLELGDIRMSPATETLDEVTVEAKSNLMRFEKDKRVFNVAKDLSSVGSNASDILNNLPSVAVDVEGGVSLRGSNNVRILIDGKPSGLIGSDPASALRQLQSNMIERVEVITNPSARYDAEGEGGIINIVLKKDGRRGLNGSFDLSAGFPSLFGAGATINYRKGRLNWFANLSFNARRAPGQANSVQNFRFADTSYSFERDRYQERGSRDAMFRFGADYDLGGNSSLTASLLFRPASRNNLVDLQYIDLDQLGERVRQVNRLDEEEESRNVLEADLHWEKRYGEDDKHKWTADLRFNEKRDLEQSQITQDTSGIADQLLQRIRNLERERSWVAQTDYIRPLGKNSSYEVGGRATLRTIDNDYLLSTLAPGGDYLPDPEFDNEFQFVENVYAAYGIYNGKLGERISYQGGLRGEITQLTTTFADDEPNERNFANLFPSAFVTYSFSPLSDLQASYSRRINRPGFWTLTPFFGFSDNRNFFSGNPDVNPEFADSYELGYLRYFEKGSLYSGLYYRHRTDVVQRISVVEIRDGQEFTRIFPVNLATQDAYGFEFNFQYDFYDWFNTNANLNLFRAVTVGEFEGQDFGADNYSSTLRLINRFKFWNSDLQVSFNMRAAQVTPQGRQLGIYTMDLGWSRDLLDNKATLTLAVRDLFNTRYRRSYTSGLITGGGQFDSFSQFQWRVRQITLNFSYRLNQSKKKGGPPREGMEGMDGGF